MKGAARRFARQIARLGEPFTVGGTAGRGVFAAMSPGFAAVYLGKDAADLATKPIRMAYVHATDATAENATLAWRGRNYLVRRAEDVRIANVTVARLLVLTLI